MVDLPHDWAGALALAVAFFGAGQLTTAPITDDDKTQEAPMQAQGKVYMSRTPMRLSAGADGTPHLVLLTVHRIGSHQTEPWTLHWRGPAAAEFFTQHQSDMRPGQVLSVTLTNVRTHAAGRVTEVQAEVQSCVLHQPQGAPA